MAESIILKAGGGADLDIITAVAGDIIAGKVTVDREGNPVSGTMVNNGNHNASLNCGQSKAIPAGYTTGGTVTANSLASQTGGVTADDTKVLSGYTYWRDGAKRTGNMAVQSIINFRAALYSTRAIMLTWQNPARGPYSGVAITYRTDGRYPNSVGDGVNCYDGSATNALISNIPANVGVYFRAWSYMTTNQGRVYGGNLDAYAVASEIKGRQTFTSSGVFTVPAGVYSVDAFLVGGGGSGWDGSGSRPRDGINGGSGCWGGYTSANAGILVSPGQQINVVVGGANGDTIFSSYKAARGDSKNKAAWYGHGAGFCNGSYKYEEAPTAGSGPSGYSFDGAAYSGGGGGGGLRYGGIDVWYEGVYGGAGGGGRGGTSNSKNGDNGAPNTGSGGGGGFKFNTTNGVGGAGAAGICIIRWGY